jgi:DNA-binding transcriptional regulator GbsR (MarR family)
VAETRQEPVEEAELAVAEAIGQLMEFWGFKRPMGRLWTLIYLSPEPSTAAELGERLRMSAGSVSMTLAELLKWGTIRKTWKPGDRRDFFEAETSINKLVARVLRERELRLVRQMGAVLSDAEASLPARGDRTLEFKRDRIRRLRELARVGERLLSALAAGKQVDPSPIERAAGGGR